MSNPKMRSNLSIATRRISTSRSFAILAATRELICGRFTGGGSHHPAWECSGAIAPLTTIGAATRIDASSGKRAGTPGGMPITCVSGRRARTASLNASGS
ncbi:hypothetical protein F0160_10200 [Paraburkholderia sp. JPY303]|nr:hypothetical protein [Paraburkholderia atlantica]